MTLNDDERSELVKLIRAATFRIEEIYRPARETVKDASADPVLLALYAARDNLMEAERHVLRTAFDKYQPLSGGE